MEDMPVDVWAVEEAEEDKNRWRLKLKKLFLWTKNLFVLEEEGKEEENNKLGFEGAVTDDKNEMIVRLMLVGQTLFEIVQVDVDDECVNYH